jgi:transposase
MRILERRTFVHFTQVKGRCAACRKVRLEAIDFISHESPHLTRRYAFLLGRLCEIAPVSRVADLMGHGKMTLWRVDLERMERYFKDYNLPEGLTHLSIDEVYARSKHEEGETRNDRFFTVITDLTTHKVIWVEQSRSRSGLDRFFALLGPERCKKIEVVATDQHEDYACSIREHCLNAIQVFDRFHLMKAFEEAVNDTRKILYKMLPQSAVKKLAKGKYRFVFLKAERKRTEEERLHMQQVMKDNEAFFNLELIKERMLSFFDERDAKSAWEVFREIGDWIFEAGFPPLKAWWRRVLKQWQTIANYFTYRVTTALSEGVNNVIKSVKRAAFGFRNMDYFRLKILQRCGFLNSQYMTDEGQWIPKARALLGLT